MYSHMKKNSKASTIFLFVLIITCFHFEGKAQKNIYKESIKKALNLERDL